MFSSLSLSTRTYSSGSGSLNSERSFFATFCQEKQKKYSTQLLKLLDSLFLEKGHNMEDLFSPKFWLKMNSKDYMKNEETASLPMKNSTASKYSDKNIGTLNDIPNSHLAKFYYHLVKTRNMRQGKNINAISNSEFIHAVSLFLSNKAKEKDTISYQILKIKENIRKIRQADQKSGVSEGKENKEINLEEHKNVVLEDVKEKVKGSLEFKINKFNTTNIKGMHSVTIAYSNQSEYFVMNIYENGVYKLKDRGLVESQNKSWKFEYSEQVAKIEISLKYQKKGIQRPALTGSILFNDIMNAHLNNPEFTTILSIPLYQQSVLKGTIECLLKFQIPPKIWASFQNRELLKNGKQLQDLMIESNNLTNQIENLLLPFDDILYEPKVGFYANPFGNEKNISKERKLDSSCAIF